MKPTTKNITLITLLIASGVAMYFYHSWDAENSRLRGIVESEFTKIKIPPGSKLIYQEVAADRICKTAEIKQLFASPKPVADICDDIYTPLKITGWKSHDGCRTHTYPLKRAPIDGDRPSYSFYNLAAASASTKFGVTVDAQPKDAWGFGSFFMLSAFGEDKAIPLARKAGETFFTVGISYTEDRALYESLCPKNHSQCDCDSASTLFSWKFQDGRQFSRSW